MEKCSEECIPCCDLCAFSKHGKLATDGTSGPIGCFKHTDWEHQEIAISDGSCEDFKCIMIAMEELKGDKVKLKNVTEIDAFRGAVDACVGNVWLESHQGDKFNLKSAFSQYIALGALLGENGDRLELFCQLPEDREKFYRFFYENPEVLK